MRDVFPSDSLVSFVLERDSVNHMKPILRLVFAVASLALVLGFSSCSLLHNQNDWAFNKGESFLYMPWQIGKEGAGTPVRGENTSCSLLHNQNDWAFNKGDSNQDVLKQIGKEGAGTPVRGEN